MQNNEELEHIPFKKGLKSLEFFFISQKKLLNSGHDIRL